MAIEFACPKCEHRFRVKDSFRGRKGTCPTCKAEVIAEGERVPDHDVFISHANQDNNVAEAVRSALENGRVRCWMASRDVPVGKTWASSIIDAIEESRVMVLVFSAHSNQSDQVLREVERAVAKGVVIIPVRIEDVTMSKDLEYFLSARHWLDALTEPVEHYTAQLTTQAKAILGEEGPSRLEELPPVERPESAPSPARDTATSPLASRYRASFAAAVRETRRYQAILSTRTIVISMAAVALIVIIVFSACSPSTPEQKGPNSPRTTPPGESVARVPAATAPASTTRNDPAPAKPPPANESPTPANSGEPLDLQWTETGDQGVLTLPGDVEMVFEWIPPGTFMMGSPEDEPNRASDEGPQHEVTLTSGFWMGIYEVTQGQWQAVMGNNPSHFKGSDQLPAVGVSWIICQDYVGRLNTDEAGVFRLPTEAEWEYACRAGTATAYSFGDSSSDLGSYAWYSSNSGNKTHEVGQKKPNDWVLYDMHGNVWEWCEDWHGNDYYESSSSADPRGPSSGTTRVLRGGSWFIEPRSCRSAYRHGYNPLTTNYSDGFRVVFVPR